MCCDVPCFSVRSIHTFILCLELRPEAPASNKEINNKSQEHYATPPPSPPRKTSSPAVISTTATPLSPTLKNNPMSPKTAAPPSSAGLNFAALTGQVVKNDQLKGKGTVSSSGTGGEMIGCMCVCA